jgi:hypothetical protein
LLLAPPLKSPRGGAAKEIAGVAEIWMFHSLNAIYTHDESLLNSPQT